MRKLFYIILVILAFFIIIGLYYLNCSLSLEKTLDNDKNVLKVLDIVPIGTERLVFFDSGQFVEARSYRRKFFGWKSTGTASPLLKNFPEDLNRSIERIGSITVEQNQVYFGVVDPNLIKEVRVYNNNYEIHFHVHSYYWYIPIWSSQDNKSDHKIKLILHDGSEIKYTFINVE